MPIEAYLIFNGNCRQAIEFYTQAFNSEPAQIMHFGDAPPNPNYTPPEETKQLVMHARMSIGGTDVMLSDSMPDTPVVVGNNITLVVNLADMEELNAIFDKLKVGGKVIMELQETFWSKYYGMLTDKFGVSWQLNYCTKN